MLADFTIPTAMKDATYLESRGIVLPSDPPSHVLRKARQVVAQMEKGLPYWKLRGKRLKRNRKVISIPVGRRWRLVGLDEEGTTTLKELLSHAQYNTRVHTMERHR